MNLHDAKEMLGNMWLIGSSITAIQQSESTIITVTQKG